MQLVLIKFDTRQKKWRGETLDSPTNAVKTFVDNVVCCAISFDGKKDETGALEHNEETNRYHPRVITEDHYTINFHPNSMFYTHVTPEGTKAIHIADALLKKMYEDEINVDKIFFVGSDGTNVNVGHLNGNFKI